MPLKKQPAWKAQQLYTHFVCAILGCERDDWGVGLPFEVLLHEVAFAQILLLDLSDHRFASNTKRARGTIQLETQWRVLEKIPGRMEASFLMFLTLGSIQQINTAGSRCLPELWVCPNIDDLPCA